LDGCNREAETGHFLDRLRDQKKEKKNMKGHVIHFQVIFVEFWRWCIISVKRIVFLDSIHRLVSQEQETKLN
jgi:hypothetical protein